MKTLFKPVWLALASGLLAYIGLPAGAAFAQQGSDEAIEEIITTGTRRAERSASDSSVPIDVITGQEFENMGTADLDDMLRTAVPSYNLTRHAISDAATLVRPATMRGLPPDNVLVLVNGKRRHRSGVIAELGGSLAEGSQGADLAAIPAMSIKQVEVLRDGAAAQYGSDAIAGVMNFVLRDDADGFSVEARTGEFMEGDGTLFQIMGNAGLPLGPDGFFNVTGTWMEQDPTSRSSQRTDAATLISSGAPDQQTSVRQPYAQIWGAPEYRDNWNIFVNSGIQLTNSQEVYLFGNFGRRETEGGFFYRNPNSRDNVYTADFEGVTYRAIVDTNLQGTETNYVSNCPALVSPGSGGSGTPLDPMAVDADYAARQALPANCFLMNSIVPGGYTPQFGGMLTDASIVGGVRGELDNGLIYDMSSGYGRNKAQFFLNNTWNPSLGPDAITNGQLQRNFDIGSYVQSETNINVDFVYPIAVDAFASDLNFAFGAEYRDERFETIIGEVNAWDSGRFAFQTTDNTNCYGDGVTCATNAAGNPIPLINLSIGAHGFAGFSPPQAGLWGRSNYAVYADAEADLTESFTLGVAVRYEDFESFGDTTNGKIAARWAITDRFAVRASANTGFRAPTPGQENVTKVSTITINGELQQRGQIPPTNPIAMILGARALTPEESVNYSAGFVWDATDRLSLTLDYYNIEVDDRISQTGTIDIRAEQANDPKYSNVSCPVTKGLDGDLAACLQEIGVPGAADLSAVSFYTNDFKTTTQGIDLVATYDVDWGGAGNGTITALWNWTSTDVDNAGSEVDRNKVVDLENFNPENRGIFTYNHFLNDWRFLLRASWYGDWVESDFSGDTTPRGPTGSAYTLTCSNPSGGLFADQCYDGEWIFDAEVAYTFAERYSIIVGAQNLFDESGPLEIDNLDGTVGSGNTFETSSPFGYDGGFWYVRLRADFD